MGLGKTIEAGLILRELNARRRAARILIICPASIIEQWQTELASKSIRHLMFGWASLN